MSATKSTGILTIHPRTTQTLNGQGKYGTPFTVPGKIVLNVSNVIAGEDEATVYRHVLYVRGCQTTAVKLQDLVEIDGKRCEIVANFGNKKFGVA